MNSSCHGNNISNKFKFTSKLIHCIFHQYYNSPPSHILDQIYLFLNNILHQALSIHQDMFSHTSASRGAAQPGTSPGATRVSQRSAAARTVRPSTLNASQRVPMPVSKTAYVRTPEAPVVAERYTNRAYNRQPSPPPRFPRPTTHEEERPRDRGQGTRPTNNRSQTNMTRPRLLETCQPQPHRRPERSESTSSMTSQRVLLAVKDVLSRAVLERGRIDEDNLGTIIRTMKSRLFGGEPEDEVRPSIDVEMKESRMMVNVERSSEALPMTKPTVGLVRRQVSDPPPKPYLRVYPRSELPAARGIETLPDGDEVVYIDLPDSDYSNFNSLMKSDKRRSRSSVAKNSEFIYEEQDGKANKENHQRENTKDETAYDNHTVGDGYPMDAYKASEDLKLQRYIETLIRNMNDQLTGKKSCENIEVELDNKTICKSFCVCKVCVSNSSPPKKTSRESRLSLSQSKNEDVDVIPKPSVVDAVPVQSPVRQKVASPTPRRSSIMSGIRVVKKSGPVEPVRAVACPSDPSEFYTVVQPGHTEEAADDMYLQRRLRSPARRSGR